MMAEFEKSPELAEFEERSPDWCVLPQLRKRLLENVTNENETERSPGKQSSGSSIEVIDEDETFNGTCESSADVVMNAAEKHNRDVSGLTVPQGFGRILKNFEEMETDLDVTMNTLEEHDKDLSELAVPQQFTEDKETASATEGGLTRNNKKVTKRKVTVPRNTSQLKIKMMNKLVTDITDAVTNLLLLAFILYLVALYFREGSNSEITASINELKEENKLIREELSNFMKKENFAMDPMLQELVERFENQSLPARKEFDELKEQVKNLEKDIKMLQDRISGGNSKFKADALKFSQKVRSHFGKFTDMVSSLYKQIFSRGNKVQEKILDEKVSSSASKASDFSKPNPDETKGIKKLMKELHFVMSNCLQSVKSYGVKGAAFLEKIDKRIGELLVGPLPEAEIEKNTKTFQDLLVKLKNNPECMKIIKEKEMVSS